MIMVLSYDDEKYVWIHNELRFYLNDWRSVRYEYKYHETWIIQLSFIIWDALLCASYESYITYQWTSKYCVIFCLDESYHVFYTIINDLVFLMSMCLYLQSLFVYLIELFYYINFT